MRILKVEPGKAPYAKEMEEGLKAIQREVEGLFQPLSMGAVSYTHLTLPTIA